MTKVHDPTYLSHNLTTISFMTFAINTTKYTEGCRGWVGMINVNSLTYMVKMSKVIQLIEPAKSAMGYSNRERC